MLPNTNRKSLINGAMDMNPVVLVNRLSSGGRRNLSFNDSANISALNDVADDEERERKRRQYHRLAVHRQSLHSPAQAAPLRKSTVASTLSNDQLKEHYSICIKLSATNKINTKNAFGLHLIDYMSDLLQGNKDGPMNFKLASSALDAGAKIYCNRVDFVHAEAQKVASGLVMALDSKSSTTNSQEQNDNDVIEANDDNTEEEDCSKPKKKKVRKNVRTIVQNIEQINVSKIETTVEVDPVFHQISMAFDMGSTNGLLMANLRSDPNGLLMLDSNAHFDVNVSNNLSSMQLISNKIIKDLEEISISTAQIYPPLATFDFSNREGAIDLMIRSEEAEENRKKSSFTFDMNAEVEDVEPIDDNQDIFDDDDCGSEHSDAQPEEPNVRKSLLRAVNMVAVKDLMNLLSDKPNEYSYFNPKLLGTWAGPTHWKRNPLQNRERFQKEGENRTKQRQRKQYTEKDYTKEELDINSDKTSGSDLKLKVSTLEKWRKQAKELQLPPDHGFDPKRLAQSFNKPNAIFQRAKDSKEINEINTENENSFTCPGSPEIGIDNYDDEDDNGEGFQIGTQPLAQSAPTSMIITNDDPFAFIGDNLVEQPYNINEIQLPYAKYAKKMDVKKLKKAMWGILTTGESVPMTPIIQVIWIIENFGFTLIFSYRIHLRNRHKSN